MTGSIGQKDPTIEWFVSASYDGVMARINQGDLSMAFRANDTFSLVHIFKIRML